MSEVIFLDAPTHRERQDNTQSRRSEIESLLAQLANKAMPTYELLRPHSKHIGSAALGEPLRHQQTRHFGQNLVNELLIVSFDENHELTLFHNHAEKRLFSWQFRRLVTLDYSTKENTTVHVRPLPRSPAEVAKVDMNFERYGRVHERSHIRNDYKNAEIHIEAFAADLDEAATRFS